MPDLVAPEPAATASADPRSAAPVFAQPMVFRLGRPSAFDPQMIVFVLLVAFTVIGAWTGGIGTAPEVVLAAVACPAAFVALAVHLRLCLRARTILAYDGIRTRGLGAETSIPWHEVKDVVVTRRRPARLRVVRAGGDAEVTLTAVREGRVDLDRAAELIMAVGARARPPDGERHWQGDPLRLRPSRKPLLILIPMAIAVPASVVAHAAGVAVAPFVPALLPISLFQLWLAVELICGLTVADESGIRIRTIGPSTFLPWDTVARIQVVATLFGRTAKVTPRSKRAADLPLAAPREGLLARDPDFRATVERLATAAGRHGFTEPKPAPRRFSYAALVALSVAVSMVTWLLEGPPPWPHERLAVRLPDACSAVDPRVPARLVPGGVRDPGTTGHGRTFSSCGWSRPIGENLPVPGLPRALYVMLTVYEPHHVLPWSRSGVDRAREAFRATPDGFTRAGDDRARRPGEDENRVRLRRANVVIEIDALAPLGPDGIRQVDALADAIAARIDLE